MTTDFAASCSDKEIDCKEFICPSVNHNNNSYAWGEVPSGWGHKRFHMIQELRCHYPTRFYDVNTISRTTSVSTYRTSKQKNYFTHNVDNIHAVFISETLITTFNSNNEEIRSMKSSNWRRTETQLPRQLFIKWQELLFLPRWINKARRLAALARSLVNTVGPLHVILGVFLDQMLLIDTLSSMTDVGYVHQIALLDLWHVRTKDNCKMCQVVWDGFPRTETIKHLTNKRYIRITMKINHRTIVFAGRWTNQTSFVFFWQINFCKGKQVSKPPDDIPFSFVSTREIACKTRNNHLLRSSCQPKKAITLSFAQSIKHVHIWLFWQVASVHSAPIRFNAVAFGHRILDDVINELLKQLRVKSFFWHFVCVETSSAWNDRELLNSGFVFLPFWISRFARTRSAFFFR